MKRFADRSTQVNQGCKQNMGFWCNEDTQGQGSSVSTKKRNLSPQTTSLLIVVPAILHTPELCLVYKEILIADWVHAMSEPREGVVNTVTMVLAYTVFTLALACGLLFFPF